MPNAFAELTIGNYSLQSKERVNRTDYAYTYKADITNTGDAVINASATVNSLSDKTKVTVDSLSFGSVGAKETVTSNDTFILTQDRRAAFNPDDLVWEITADPAVISDLPPDPGEAGKATLEGIDSDNDGVRDDIQRYIALTYPESEKVRVGSLQLAKAMQIAILGSSTKQKSISSSFYVNKSIECLSYLSKYGIDGSEVIANLIGKLVNTVDRYSAYSRYNQNLSGNSFRIPQYDRKSSCDFDPEKLLK